MQAWLLHLISPLHILGPVAVTAILAVFTVLFARSFTRRFKTRRYKELEQEFAYWFNLKQEAVKMRDEDPEKARQLGINIDKGKLNEIYYNYFFEGFLNNLLTTYIPIFSMLAFVNYSYRPESLTVMFGKDHLFELLWLNGRTYAIGPAFWFVSCVFATYLACFLGSFFIKRFNARRAKPGRKALVHPEKHGGMSVNASLKQDAC